MLRFYIVRFNGWEDTVLCSGYVEMPEDSDKPGLDIRKKIWDHVGRHAENYLHGDEEIRLHHVHDGVVLEPSNYVKGPVQQTA